MMHPLRWFECPFLRNLGSVSYGWLRDLYRLNREG